MRSRVLFFVLFFLLIFGGAARAFTNNFNALIKSQELTTLVNQGQTYHLSITVKSNQTSQIAYPVAFALAEGSYGRNNSWVTFDDDHLDINNLTETTLNFNLTVPADTPVGEYIKAVGVSDLPFTDGESDNPPTAIAIPITIQVTEAEVIPTQTPIPTPTPRIDTDDNDESSLPSVAVAVNTPAPTPILKIDKSSVAKKTLLKIPEQVVTDDLFSKLQLVGFYSVYDPLRQEQIFHLRIKNNGNISSIPLGSINITNSAKKVLDTIDINPNSVPIKPNATSEFLVYFSSNDFLLGQLFAELNFGYANSKHQKEPILTAQIVMPYIGKIPILIIAFSTVLIVLIALFSPFAKKKLLNYSLIFILVCISFALLGYCYKLSEKAAENYLGVSDLELHATVSQQLIMKTIVTNTGDQQIEISGNNSLGVVIWSLQNDSRIKLNEVAEHTSSIDTFLLTGIMKRFPILILTRGY